MKPTDFLTIHIGDVAQERAPGTEAPASRGGQAAAGGGYSARFGWIGGVPYLIDLGSADTILVNGTPIAPYSPVIIQTGDTISMGNTRLTWNATAVADQPGQEPGEAQATPEPVLAPEQVPGLPPTEIPEPALDVPTRAAEPRAPEAPEPPSAAEPPAPEAPEPALDVPTRVAEPPAPEAPEATLVVPEKAAEPPVPQAPEPALDVPTMAAEPPAPEVPEATVVVPKKAAEPPSPEVPEATLVVPKRAVEPPPPEVPEATLVVPKRAARPPAPEAPEATLAVPKRAAQPRAPQTEDRGVGAPGATDRATEDTGAYKTVWVDMAQLLEEDTEPEFVSATILRDTQIPHLVVHMPNRTWEVQFTKESTTIGRGERNDITLPEKSVSERHALIERRASGYVIRDTGSSNGTWLGKQRIEEHLLRDGDVVSLGRAKLVFKGGFVPDQLTLIGTPRIDGKPMRRPVVFVPGMMGSELWIGSERLWPNPRTILSNVEVFSLPGDPRIEARGIVNEVVIIPNIIQSRQYSAMGDYLETGLGYTRGKDLLEFAYDWRHDVRLSAQRLAEAIERWQAQAPITIIAHSLGTLVTRYYVERLGGKRFVERVILMGGPHYGSAKGLAAILVGPGILPFGMGAERMRLVLATFPSAYQILPTYPCVFDQHDNQIEVLEDELWLPQAQRPFLGAARSFHREVGTSSSVPTVSIFGYGLKTKLRVKIHRGPDGLWQKVDFVEDAAGDQSVPSGSAVLQDSEIHPVLQEHGSLYVDDDVRMRLKIELTRSTTWQRSK